MRTFPSTDLKQTLGDVLDAASQEPITITKHSKPRFVLMSIHDYERRFQKDERQVFMVDGMPPDHLAMLETSLEGNQDETNQ